MLLSDIFEKYKIDVEYKIVNEREFDTLGLVVSENELTMCSFLDNIKYIDEISENLKMLLVTKEVADKISSKNIGLCITEKPRILFFKLHNLLQNDSSYARERYNTVIGDNCNISEHACISSNNVTIGNNVVIEEFVSIKENTVIGDDCIIRAGTVIGGEGFEFKRVNDGVLGVKHLGGVIIGKNVEIQHNTCVDKAVYPWDNTILEDYVKVDNLVHIAHAVKINKNSMIVANVGIGGRTEIGKDSWIGFGATVSNGLKVGDSGEVSIGAIVTKNVAESTRVTGNFAIEHSKFISHMKNIR